MRRDGVFWDNFVACCLVVSRDGGALDLHCSELENGNTKKVRVEGEGERGSARLRVRERQKERERERG